MHTRRWKLPLVALVVAAWLVPMSARGQDVRYTTVSRAEFGGALGRMMKLMGGTKDATEVTSIKGLRMRTDDEGNSTVLDLEGRAFTWMDHESKTYMTMTFEQAAARAKAAMEGMEDSLKAAEDQAPDAEPETVRYEVRFATDRTGKRAKVAGYEAEQVFFQLDIEAIPIRQEDETEEEAMERAGTLVILSDLWLSTTFPGYQAKKAQERRWAEILGSTETGSPEMAQAFKFDPRIKQGFERLAEEMKGIEGEAIRSMIHVVSVPHGVTFDRAPVLKDANKKLSDDVAGAAAEGAKNAAVGAITGGLFGRKREAEPPKPKQGTFMRIRSEVTQCSTAPLGDDVFLVPAGYAERSGM
ncbi:MAG: hypothetical protein OER21_08005 [Gemmatimonadota bacterium]|nr:hypothetical protein [Gemmatimonadota bacterium]